MNKKILSLTLAASMALSSAAFADASPKGDYLSVTNKKTGDNKSMGVWSETMQGLVAEKPQEFQIHDKNNKAHELSKVMELLQKDELLTIDQVFDLLNEEDNK